jgi:hypothetical protein
VTDPRTFHGHYVSARGVVWALRYRQERERRWAWLMNFLGEWW